MILGPFNLHPEVIDWIMCRCGAHRWNYDTWPVGLYIQHFRRTCRACHQIEDVDVERVDG